MRCSTGIFIRDLASQGGFVNQATPVSPSGVVMSPAVVSPTPATPATPLVSICCTTYNHAPFIRAALDGFLAQEVDFPIEILVNDDASTDGTPEILREYEQAHPALIRVVYQAENQYSKGVRPMMDLVLPRAQGMYLALCEGDDYWTDRQKLRKQLRVLEGDPRLAACFTNAVKQDTIADSATSYVRVLDEGRVPERDVVMGGGGIYPTASLLFRRDRADRALLDTAPELPGDLLLIYILMANGGVYYLPETTCVYRRWTGGVYSSIAHDTAALARRKELTLTGYGRLAATELLRPYAGQLTEKASRDALQVIRHLGVLKGRHLLRYLRSVELARLARDVLSRDLRRAR